MLRARAFAARTTRTASTRTHRGSTSHAAAGCATPSCCRAAPACRVSFTRTAARAHRCHRLPSCLPCLLDAWFSLHCLRACHAAAATSPSASHTGWDRDTRTACHTCHLPHTPPHTYSLEDPHSTSPHSRTMGLHTFTTHLHYTHSTGFLQTYTVPHTYHHTPHTGGLPTYLHSSTTYTH